MTKNGSFYVAHFYVGDYFSCFTDICGQVIHVMWNDIIR